MKLEGKAKTEFGHWFLDSGLLTQYNEFKCLNEFYKLDFSFQWGVYVDFFDSVGIYISLSPTKMGVGARTFDTGWKYPRQEYTGLFVYHVNGSVSREMLRYQAREEAIKKAVEIYNNR